jgi:hypothetical protein
MQAADPVMERIGVVNLADAYRRSGDAQRAREHLAAGRAALSTLRDDGYRRQVRSGLDRLAPPPKLGA